MRFVSEASWFDFKFFFCTFCLVLCEHECPFSSSSSSLPLTQSLSPSLTISLMHTLSLKVIHSLKYLLCLSLCLCSRQHLVSFSLSLSLPLLHNLSIYLFAYSHIIFLFHTYLLSFLSSPFSLSHSLSLYLSHILLLTLSFIS